MNESIPVNTNATTTNPKDLFGSKKVNVGLIPPVALLHEAHAMMDGAKKYEPFNWRARSVQAMIYVAALLRHVEAWADGEEDARDSGCHHLGHARSCLGILLDAQEYGNLVDDRPKDPKGRQVFADVLERLNKKIAASAVTAAVVAQAQTHKPLPTVASLRVDDTDLPKWARDPKALEAAGPGHRILVPGEVLEKGDQFFQEGRTPRWVDTDEVGNTIGFSTATHCTYRRRIPHPFDIAVQAERGQI